VEIRTRITASLGQDPDTMTQANLQSRQEQIDKTLQAFLQLNEP